MVSLKSQQNDYKIKTGTKRKTFFITCSLIRLYIKSIKRLPLSISMQVFSIIFNQTCSIQFYCIKESIYFSLLNIKWMNIEHNVWVIIHLYILIRLISYSPFYWILGNCRKCNFVLISRAIYLLSNLVWCVQWFRFQERHKSSWSR